MAAKLIMKYPVLIMGIIMISLFLWDLKSNNRSILLSRDKLMPTSCSAVIVKLSRRVPGHWKVDCKENDLQIEYPVEANIPNLDTLRQGIYKDLVNNMVLATRNSPIDSLENVRQVQFIANHKQLEIKAIISGKSMVKFATMNEPKFIMDHLRATTVVKETLK